MTSSDASPATKVAPHRNLVLLAVGSTMFLGMVDGSIVNVALPTLASSFRAPFHVVQWTVLSFLLGLSSLTLSMGRLGDIVGKKRVFITGVCVFLASSALCGAAPGVYFLILFRFIQSIGAAMMASLGVAIVAETWPADRRATAMGIAGGILSLGGITGPALGGWILHALSWRWIFFVNLPIGLVSLVLACVFVPPLFPERREQRFDFPGALLAGVSMFTFALAMTSTQALGLFSTRVVSLAAVSLVTLLAFLYAEQRVPDPMLDLSLFRNSGFRVSLVTGFAVFVSLAGVVLLFPFYLQFVGRLQQQQVGMVMAVTPAMMAFWGPFSGMCADRFGARPVIVIGMASMVVGYLLMSRLTAASTPTAFVLLQAPLGLGMATFSSANNAAIMTSVPRQRLGIANGMLAMSRTAGNLTGVALLGTFFVVRLQAHVGQAVEVTAAPRVAIVQALHEQFYLAAALIFVGAVVAFRQWSSNRVGIQDGVELEVEAG